MTPWHKLRWIASNWLLLAACFVSPRDDLEHVEHVAAAARRAASLVKGTAGRGRVG